jgi:hypothetical protein
MRMRPVGKEKEGRVSGLRPCAFHVAWYLDGSTLLGRVKDPWMLSLLPPFYEAAAEPLMAA